MNNALNSQILDAHEKADSNTLAKLYWQASATHIAAGELDQACFFLTQAYIFALEAGSQDTEEIAKMLKRHNRL